MTLSQLAKHHKTTPKEIVEQSRIPLSTLYVWVKSKPKAIELFIDGIKYRRIKEDM